MFLLSCLILHPELYKICILNRYGLFIGTYVDNIEVLYLVVFYSIKINPTKYNYEIYNKELIAIIKAFEE